VPEEKHVITCNEGAAVSVAAGYHLATGRAAMVYLQNSGLGNAVNPLVRFFESIGPFETFLLKNLCSPNFPVYSRTGKPLRTGSLLHPYASPDWLERRARKAG